MNRRAFTLIELLIVITIIILVTSGWVMYFFKQISSMKLTWEIQKVVDIIDNLDAQVRSRKILDYSFIIDTSKNQRWFNYTTNILGLNSIQELDFHSENWTGTLSTTSTSTWSYVFRIYSWVKFESEQIIDSTDTIIKSFLNNQEYKISATLSWTILNDMYINYYSEDNIDMNWENYLKLIAIKNKAWTTSYTSVNISNLNWKKSIIPDWWTEVNEVYLYFEREWIQKFIEIKK